MFITRAGRRDTDEIAQLYKDNEWGDDLDLTKGVAFIARQGPVVGAVRLLELEPQTVIVEDVVVDEVHRGNGIGAQLMRAAMNSRGGKLFLSCHADVIPFYERFGFAERPFDDLPVPVQEYFRATGDYPSDPGHQHYFLTAR
jgi:predicted GNAT family N-acyltransferase